MSKLNNLLYGTLFSIFIILIYSGLIHPSYSDFDFWHILRLSSIERTHTIDPTNSNPGYLVFMVMIKSLLGIPFEQIYQIPIIIIPTFISILFVLYKMSHSIPVASSFSFLFVISTADVSAWVAGSHQIALVLLYSIIGTLLIRHTGPNEFNEIRPTILLVILIIAVNLLSYKVMFVVLVMLFALFVIQFISHRLITSITASHAVKFALITGIVLVIFFNPFFYNIFIPELITFTDFSTSSGISKLLSFFDAGSSGQSSGLNQAIPHSIGTLALIRTLLMGALLMLYLLYIIYSIIKKRTFEKENQIILAIIFSGIGLFVVYSLFGLAELTIFSVAALLLIYKALFIITTHRKSITYVVFIILLVGNTISFTTSISGAVPLNNVVDTTYGSMESVSHWSFNHILIAGETDISSDVFTTGLLNYHFSNNLEYQTQYVSVLSYTEVKSIISTEAETTLDHEYYVLNGGLEHFSIMGWDKFSSWPKLLDHYPLNAELCRIYCNNNIYILNNHD